MFSERLKIALDDRGITQVQLAQELGFTSAAINRWCQKITQPDSETIVKIARFLKVSTDYLLGNDNVLNESDEKLKEKEALKKALVNAGYMSKDEDLSKEELERLMEFVKTNKKYIKEVK